jgi:hypothetical protein
MASSRCNEISQSQTINPNKNIIHIRPVTMSEFIFTARSERVGVIGCVQLTRVQIGSLVGGTTDTRQSSQYSLTMSLMITLTSFLQSFTWKLTGVFQR